MNNINHKIDSLLQTRRRALYDLEKSVEELYKLGLRFFSPGEGDTPEIASYQNLDPRFEQTLEDWEWEAVYNDGSILYQYSEHQVSHFGHIDQSRLEKIIYTSNFLIDTTNEEKHAKVTLNVKTGTFEFINCGPMDVRGKTDKENSEEKKVILFKRKRKDFTAGVTQIKGQVNIDPTGEEFVYQRYYLGYETPTKKLIVCLYPDGDIGIEE